jgi:tetratricopeptide (TPR) repeat protein
MGEYMENRERLSAFFLVFVLVFGFYLYTMQPTASFWDASEYLACGYTLGVPHPPGSPLHVLIRRLFSFLPITDDPAFGMNLFSSLSCAIASALIFLMVITILCEWKQPKRRLDKAIIHSLGFCSASVAAFSFTPWWNAVEAEAYAPATFIFVFSLWLAFLWRHHLSEANSGRMIILIAYLFALSIGIHLIPLLAGPGILIFAMLVKREDLRDKRKVIITALVAWFLIVILLMALKGPLGDDYSFAVGMVTAVILLALLPNIKTIRSPLSRILTLCVILIGFTTLFYLMVRAQLHPMINETAPTTLDKLWNAFSRKQYGPSEMTAQLFPRKTAIQTGYSLPVALFWQFMFYFRYFTWQFMPWPREAIILQTSTQQVIQVLSVVGTTFITILGILGMYSMYKRDKAYFWLFFAAFFFASVGIILYTNFKFSPSDPNSFHQPREVRERFYFFGPSFVMFGFFIGFGIFELFQRMKGWMKYSIPLAAVIGIIPLVSNFSSPANRHANYIPDDYGYNMLVSCDRNAILYTNGDNDTFPLWFAQAVKRTRLDVRIANLSLINTDWYIKQLKNDMGVPISFTDFEIENLMPHPAVKDGKIQRDKILFVKDFAVRDIATMNAGKGFEKRVFMPIKKEALPRKYREFFPKDMEIIPPQYYLRRRPTGEWMIPNTFWVRLPAEYLLPDDEFVKLLMKDGYEGKSPIYFATTVSHDNTVAWESYLSTEGLVRKIVPQKGGPPYNIKKTDSLVFQVYRFSSAFDKSVYKDENTRNTLSNCSLCLFALGMEYQKRGNIGRAIDCYKMGRKFGIKRIPFDQMLINLYQMTGDTVKLKKILLEMVKQNADPVSLYMVGRMKLDEGDYTEASSFFKRAQRLDPENPAGVAGMLSLYFETGDSLRFLDLRDSILQSPKLTGNVVGFLMQGAKREIAKEVLKRWLEFHPYDTLAQRMIREM